MVRIPQRDQTIRVRNVAGAHVSTIRATRFHDFSAGHRVVGHEGTCRHCHGHNYRIHFTCEADTLDNVGRVVDFSVIKERLCVWLEEHWDHKFLAWKKDPWRVAIAKLDPEGVYITSFNPTAENMADYLLHVVGPMQLEGTGVRLVLVTVEETRKCQASASLER